jgi:hypothetical protein
MTKREKKNPEEQGDGLLVEAAKAIGGLAGKVAHVVGAAEPNQAKARGSAGSGEKRGKPAPKNKSRLPRRQKKAAKKAGNSRAV